MGPIGRCGCGVGTVPPRQPPLLRGRGVDRSRPLEDTGGLLPRPPTQAPSLTRLHDCTTLVLEPRGARTSENTPSETVRKGYEQRSERGLDRNTEGKIGQIERSEERRVGKE